MSDIIETPWESRQDDESIVVIHDNRWLAIVGIPLCLFGLLVAVGPWFIEEARNSDDWPILAGGSVVGLGLMVAGLSICFHYTEFVANLQSGQVTRIRGLRPFQRTKSWPIDAFKQVVCETQKLGSASNGSSLHNQLLLTGPNTSLLVASCLEKDPIILEGMRWSEFLDVPLRDTLS